MSVSIIVPFRGDGRERDRNWRFLRARYESLYPDWEIVVGACEGPWRKGVAVNDAVRHASGDVLVISDADVLVTAQALRDAVAALDDVAWVVPHRRVHRLTGLATRAVIAGQVILDPMPLVRKRMVRGAPGGGVAVVRRSGWEAVGGMDERFVGWGGEDEALARALDTLVGRHIRLGGTMWHLRHEPMAKRRGRNGTFRASPESERLAARYLEAEGDPVAMAVLVAENDPDLIYDPCPVLLRS